MPRNIATKVAPSRRSRRCAGLSPAVAVGVGARLDVDDRLSQLPLKILTMVLLSLSLKDLISLSRTCKAFRRFLYSPKASRETVWKPVLESIAWLPSCPPDLNEPQYAALLYNCGICAGCGASSWAKGIYLSPFFEIRQTLCDHCAGNKELYFRVLYHIKDTHPLSRGFKSMAEMTAMGYPKDIVDLSPKYSSDERYHVDTVAALTAEYKKKRTAKAKQAWMEEKRQLWANRKKHARICQNIMEAERKKDEARRKEIGKYRLGWIMAKLRELGWEKEARRWKKDDEFINTHCLMTDHEWTVIQPQVMHLMEVERENIRQEKIGQHIKQRIEKWLKPAFTKFVLEQPPNEINPNILDVALSNEWRTLLCTSPFEDDLDEFLVDAASERIPEIAKAWRKDRVEHFLEAIRKSKTYLGQEVTEDTLLLASTIFRCTLCRRAGDGCRGAGDVLTYPHTLVHLCHFLWEGEPEFHIVPRDAEWTAPPKSASVGEGLKKKESPGFHIVPRNAEWAVPFKSASVGKGLKKSPVFRLYCREEKHIFTALGPKVGVWDGLDPHIVFDDAAHEHMLSILDALGWSRDTTAAEMEEKQPYVECLCKCYHRSWETPTRKVLRWKKAIFECEAHEEKDGETKWFSKLDDEESLDCKQYDAKERIKSTHLNCPWCNNHRNIFPYETAPDILQHMKMCPAISPGCSSEAIEHVKKVNVVMKDGAWLHYEGIPPLEGVDEYSLSICKCLICSQMAPAKTSGSSWY